MCRRTVLIAITLKRNLPINSRIVALPAEEASVEEFEDLRERWDRLHGARNVLNVAGMLFTYLGALSRAKSNARS